MPVRQNLDPLNKQLDHATPPLDRSRIPDFTYDARHWQVHGCMTALDMRQVAFQICYRTIIGAEHQLVLFFGVLATTVLCYQVGAALPAVSELGDERCYVCVVLSRCKRLRDLGRIKAVEHGLLDEQLQRLCYAEDFAAADTVAVVVVGLAAVTTLI